jgi:plasmid stabilization system protein ParE
MNVRKTDDFIADVEWQFDWYVDNAGWEVADHYLDSVQATCQLLGRQPGLGPHGGFVHPRLRDWRFFLVFRPFLRNHRRRSGDASRHAWAA